MAASPQRGQQERTTVKSRVLRHIVSSFPGDAWNSSPALAIAEMLQSSSTRIPSDQCDANQPRWSDLLQQHRFFLKLWGLGEASYERHQSNTIREPQQHKHDRISESQEHKHSEINKEYFSYRNGKHLSHRNENYSSHRYERLRAGQMRNIVVIALRTIWVIEMNKSSVIKRRNIWVIQMRKTLDR
jgi:hypothetical protein